MAREYVDCVEVAGKIVKALKVYASSVDGCETLIEFTDGTSFTSSMRPSPSVKATLFQGGTGVPQIIHEYEL